MKYEFWSISHIRINSISIRFLLSVLFVLSLHLIYCLTAPWITSLSLCFLTYIHSQGKPSLQLRFTGEKHLSIHCPHIVTCFTRNREANVQRHNKHIIDLSVSGWDETITLFHKDLEIHTKNRVLLKDMRWIKYLIPSYDTFSVHELDYSWTGNQFVSELDIKVRA